ncbi:MAG: 2OG-Fe(II) oxygenase [Myxococcota bacterium]
MSARTDALAAGVRLPDFVARRADGTPTRYYGVAGGRPTILLLGAETCSDEALRRVSATTRDRAPLHVLARGHTAPDVRSATHLFLDEDGRVHDHLGVPHGSGVLVALARDLRVAGTFPVDDIAGAVERAIAARPAPEARTVVAQAPVLLVPDVLDAALRAEVIRTWEEHGHRATGVEASRDGRREEHADRATKRRADHTIVGEALLARLTRTVGRRVMPEVRRAFAYRATRFEGFKIACYDGRERGFFRAHRDNLSPSTAHRRFALTLNLNEDYQGGELRFPEYGPHLYRPAAGEALVFSGSLLHEVLPVREGRRFVLLSFLFDGGRPG